MATDEEDVLSLSAHESWPTEEDSQLSELDFENEEFLVLDEVTEEEPPVVSAPEEGNDVRIVLDQGIGEELCAGLSSRALGPVEDPASGDGPVISKNRIRTCYVCGLQSREKMKRHVMREHLPWFWSAATACWDCNRQEAQTSSLAVRHSLNHQVGCTFDDDNLHVWCLLVNGSLHLLASWLKLKTLDELLQYAIDRQLHAPLQSTFSEQEKQFLLFYVQTYSPKNVQQLLLKPPNHVACLTNWEMMASLLRRVSTANQKKFHKYRKCLTYEGEDVQKSILTFPEPFIFVDTHFHLELTVKRLELKNFLHMQQVIAPRDDHGFYYGVANFVFPRHWRSWKSVIGLSRTVYVTFGVHPHEASFGISKTRMEELKSLLDDERCVGVGETGLDLTTHCRCSPCRHPTECSQQIKLEQEKAFKEHLQLSRSRRLPVVIHCRDNGNGAAAARAFEIIAEQNCLHLKIHRHCFVGSLDELHQWQTLPNVAFGLTWKSVKECPTGVPRIPVNQLLLESDSPFLSPFTCGPTNHPWNLRAVAEKAALLRNVPLSVLNWTTNQNALQFYGIPRVLCQGPSAPSGSAYRGSSGY